MFFYNTVVAQAYRVDVSPSKITFTFLPNQKVPRDQCEGMKSVLEEIAQNVSGQKIPVAVVTIEAPSAPPSPAGAVPAAARPVSSPVRGEDAALREEAMADPSVQALFEIFPVEKSKVEEM